MKTIQVCHIKGSSSLIEELSDWLLCSKNLSKRYISKKELMRPVLPKQELVLPINLVNHNRVSPSFIGKNVDIIFEDENILVLNKPSKIHMHPLSYDESDNLVSFIRERFPVLLDVNKDSYDRGFLFRLDYETSGICFYAKNDEVYNHVRDNFSSVAKTKEYYAIVEGRVSPVQNQEICSSLLASGERGYKMKVSNVEEPNAILHYDVISYNEKEDVTLLKIRLVTGVRHQIRCQLSFIGHPILGDSLYGGRESARLYLHAFSYQIDVFGKTVVATCMPDSLFGNFFDFY